MEIKIIIINEDGMDGATRRGAGRRGRWGHIPEGRREQRHDQTTHGRVIGKLIELPDGRVKIVGRRGPDGNRRGPDGNRRGPDGSRRGPDGSRRGPEVGPRSEHRHEGAGCGHAHRDEREHSPADHEARRARRRLIREIVSALEAAEHNKA